jgi:hypothetical protein
MTGGHPAAEQEPQYRDSRSLPFGLRMAQGMDTALMSARARLIAHARRQANV